jgi:hypothetical protein
MAAAAVKSEACEKLGVDKGLGMVTRPRGTNSIDVLGARKPTGAR